MTRSNDLLVGGLTNLKNFSQWERLSHILWKIKNVPNHPRKHKKTSAENPVIFGGFDHVLVAPLIQCTFSLGIGKTVEPPEELELGCRSVHLLLESMNTGCFTGCFIC